MCNTCGCKGAEDFEAEIKYDGAKRYLRGLSTRFEGANNEGFFPAEEEDFEDMVVDEIGEHTELDAEDSEADDDEVEILYERWKDGELTDEETLSLIDILDYSYSEKHGDYLMYMIRLIEDRDSEGMSNLRRSIRERFGPENFDAEFTGIRKDSKRGYARRGMKRQYERMGMIPSPKGIASYRRKIEVPKGFKYAQIGFLALVFGAFTVNELRKRE